MTISPSLPVSRAACRLLLPLALALLAGCQSASQSSLAVTSPPDPEFGSAPIAAYDAFAWAIKPHVGTPRSAHTILISSR